MRNYKYIGILVSAIFLAGCFNIQYNHHIQPKIVKSLRITTYNINWGEGEKPIKQPNKNLQAIAATHADIVLLQEVTPFWEQQVRHSKLAKTYPYIEFKHDANGGGAAILSRYPFHTLHYKNPGIGWHPVWILNLTTPIGNIDLINAHLTPQVIKEGSVGLFGRAIFSSRPRRIREAQYIIQHLSLKQPTIIAGDFNEGDIGSAGKYFSQHGFIDGLNYHHFRQRTWEWQYGPFNFNDRFDRFFYTPSLTLLKVQVLHEGESDHYPTVGDFVKNK